MQNLEQPSAWRWAIVASLLMFAAQIGAAFIASSNAVAAALCASGLVWRERFDGDAVCVPPDQRWKLENGYCRSGYVWRERFNGDSVCVPPQQRYMLANGYCRSGYVWREAAPGDHVCVTPAQRAQAQAVVKGGAPPQGKTCPFTLPITQQVVQLPC